MPTRSIDITEPPLWSWPAERGVTADPLDRVAVEPVTLDGPRTTNTSGRPPTHLAWARQIETESSPLHRVSFSKDFTPRKADGAPIAMHQRIAIEAVETHDSRPAAQYAPVPDGYNPGPRDTVIAVPVTPHGDEHALVIRIDDDRCCPDPRGYDRYSDDVMLARFIRIEDARQDPRLPDLDARINAIKMLTEDAGVAITHHEKQSIRVAADGSEVSIPKPGRVPLEQALLELHGASIGLAQKTANESGRSTRDHEITLLAGSWAATYAGQAAAAGLRTLPCNEALRAAAEAVRKDPGAFDAAIELAAATETRLIAPAREDRDRRLGDRDTPRSEGAAPDPPGTAEPNNRLRRAPNNQTRRTNALNPDPHAWTPTTTGPAS